MVVANAILQDGEVRKLAGTIGAEVLGVDLGDGRQETADFIKETAIRNRVIAIRDQRLTREAQIDFTHRLGNTVYTRGLVHNDESPEIYIVKSPERGGLPTNNWHTDAITSRRPPSLSVLAAQILPPSGGDTLFLDMVQAYERLTPAFRRMLRGLRLHFAYRLAKLEASSETFHPIVRTIPETGERALFSGFPSAAEEIEGWSAEESKPVVDFLFRHAMNQDAIYRHRWLPGDVVIWDNRSTLHYAVHDYGAAERILVRTMIEGEEPFDAPYED